jgi:formylmethanofuran dehydrogenase subunit E|tara:strand:- start:24 stop:221 length:198 start_codon:yes stop_codon:yes gene_type:complete
MFLKVLVVLAFLGIISGLARLFKQKEFDLDNENKELVKCAACGDYLPRNLSILSSGNLFCKNCKT